MRIIKLSPIDPDFPTAAKVHDYFQHKLWGRVLQGQFFLTPRAIGENGISQGEQLLFTYKGECVYRARAATGRFPNNGPYKDKYPFFFRVDVGSIKPCRGLLSEVQKALKRAGLKTGNLVKARVWPQLPDNHNVRQIIDRIVFDAGATDELTNKQDELTRVREEQVEKQLHSSTTIGDTEKEQLILARRGQGAFRENVKRFEKRCRVTGVTDPRFLVASHIVPWRHATNEERLDGENGLLLTPNVDYLFDRGFISFTDDGLLLRSPSISPAVLAGLGMPQDTAFSCGNFTQRQREYLRRHREDIFLGECVGPRGSSTLG